LPVWLRLTKVGNTISASYSYNGTSWTQVGSPQTISLGSNYLYGMAVTSHQNGAFAEATFDSISSGTSAPLTVGTLYRVGLRQKRGTGGTAILEAFVAAGDAPFGVPIASGTAGTWTSQATRLRVGGLSPYSIPRDATFDDIRLDAAAMPGPSGS
jgi:hypothetical protein